MHTRASAFRMQLSTWTGWLPSFLSACASAAKGTHISTGALRGWPCSFPAGLGGAFGSLPTSFLCSGLIHTFESFDTAARPTLNPQHWWNKDKASSSPPLHDHWLPAGQAPGHPHLETMTQLQAWHIPLVCPDYGRIPDILRDSKALTSATISGTSAPGPLKALSGQTRLWVICESWTLAVPHPSTGTQKGMLTEGE